MAIDNISWTRNVSRVANNMPPHSFTLLVLAVAALWGSSAAGPSMPPPLSERPLLPEDWPVPVIRYEAKPSSGTESTSEVPGIPNYTDVEWKSMLRSLESFRARNDHTAIGIVLLPVKPETALREEPGKFWLTTNSVATLASNGVPYRVLVVQTNSGARPDRTLSPAAPSAERIAETRKRRQWLRDEDQRLGRNQNIAERHALLHERAAGLERGMTVHEVVEAMGPPDQVLVYKPIDGMEIGFILTPVPQAELADDMVNCQMIFTPHPSFDPIFGRLRRAPYETLRIHFDDRGRVAVWQWID